MSPKEYKFIIGTDKITHTTSDGIYFECQTANLAEPIRFKAKKNTLPTTLMKASAEFMAWHAMNIWPSLSHYGQGFNGYDTVEFKSMPCEHRLGQLSKKDLADKWMSVWADCIDCGQHFGWRCKKSPDGVCHYFTDPRGKAISLINGKQHLINDPQFPLDGTYDPEYETDDCCIFCGHPEERK